MYSNKKVLLVLCVTLNFVDLNLGSNKKSITSNYRPNFDPEYPHFTPFNNEDFVRGITTSSKNNNNNNKQDDDDDGASVEDDYDDLSTSSHHSNYDLNENNDEQQHYHHHPLHQQQQQQQQHHQHHHHNSQMAADLSQSINNEHQEEEELNDAIFDDAIKPVKDPKFKEHIKPLKNFVMGLYKNYRSTYLGNRTIGTRGDGITNKKNPIAVTGGGIVSSNNPMSDTTTIIKMDETIVTDDVENKIDNNEKLLKKSKKIRRKTKSKRKNVFDMFDIDRKYNVGPGVNVSLDSDKELVNVYLDEDCLKDVFQGRGRKHDLISKILPLFILPFLIQSAIVPFVVTTLKLLLIKSIVVGKIAIFLLIVSALKNNSKYGGMNGYEASAPYIVDPPSRRSEASVGYRVEGKPTTWVN